ncbi:hypothetical protein SERLADRAFT_378060 [Serpula lacrymans var. lacrymans S7.9]|nr:uncharacterized protein SERLADRAFT_378060 [Serpula lacrymans var. lacrymans S7.9]EGO29342.1 hypothetical protein SERLADRAFT_378060 [Serpula lacrymans var. lacrymans S7.9]
MDSRGWISIALIASFNRVRQLTTDLHLVKDVLSLSSFAEVKDDWVRMRGGQWEPFVLPTAHTSVVEPLIHEATQDVVQFEPPEAEEESQVTDGEAEECDGDGEDDEEEEVEFVIGQEAAGSWTPERQPQSS